MGCENPNCCGMPDAGPQDEAIAEVQAYYQPLSLLLVDRDGGVHFIDGRTDETREHVTGDKVEVAAWTALLNEALRMLQPPQRATGGFGRGDITINPDSALVTPRAGNG